MSSRAKSTSRPKTRGGKSAASAPLPPASPMLIFSRSEHIARHKMLTEKDFLDYRFISPAALREVGLLEEVNAMLAVGHWGTLFGISGVGYRELSLEFLTTFNLQEADDGSPENAVISFRMFGRTRSMDGSAFARLVGIYTGEVDMRHGPDSLLCELPQGISPQDAWSLLTESPEVYRPRSAKSTRIVSPAMRYMQHLVGHSINARRLSSNVCSHFDLICLYSLWSREPIHLGILLARYLYQQATSQHSRGIGGTHFITLIAQNLGEFEQMGDMIRVSRGYPIDVPAMIAFRLCRYKQFPAGRRLVIIPVIPGAGDDDPRPEGNPDVVAEDEGLGRLRSAQPPLAIPPSAQPSRRSVSGRDFAADYPEFATRITSSLDRLDEFLASSSRASGSSRRTPRSPTPPADDE